MPGLATDREGWIKVLRPALGRTLPCTLYALVIFVCTGVLHDLGPAQ